MAVALSSGGLFCARIRIPGIIFAPENQFMEEFTQVRFPAKLLLFGEHILLKGAQALAVPVPVFGGHWVFGDLQNPHEQWSQICRVAGSMDPTLPIDIQQFEQDINRGLYFSSNIPQGYGLGSSGALCAAIYQRYATAPPSTDLTLLKDILGRMESCFHGKSSGIDPLTSFIQKPLLIKNLHTIEVLPRLEIPAGVTVFLADTGQKRETGRLVTWFLEQCNLPAFAAQLESAVFPVHQSMLTAWLTGDTSAFMQHLQNISTWQYHQMQPMLPASQVLQQWWIAGLSSDDTILKICGAGGGGFVLGFTTKPAEAIEFAQNNDIALHFPFNIAH
jgi:mevalonate kinase